MASLNRVLLMGNLTRDPELRYIPSGAAVTTFGMAVNRVYVTQTGEKKKDTCFLRVVVWGKMAEACGEYLSKGSPVFVEGRLQSRSWVGADNQKKSTLEVVAQNVQFLRTKGAEGTGEPPLADAQTGPETPYEDIDQSAGARTAAKPAESGDTAEEPPF